MLRKSDTTRKYFNVTAGGVSLQSILFEACFARYNFYVAHMPGWGWGSFVNILDRVHADKIP